MPSNFSFLVYGPFFPLLSMEIFTTFSSQMHSANKVLVVDSYLSLLLKRGQ